MTDLDVEVREKLNAVLSFVLDNIAYIIGVPIAIYFIYFAVSTLSWRMDLDSPAFIYKAFLMNELGQVPYRDMFVMNLPGTYLIYSIIGQSTDYSYPGFRLVDLTVIGIITVATISFLRRINKKAAFVAPALFGILYFGGGPEMSLEREIIIVGIVSLMLAAVIPFPRLNHAIKAALVGICFGAAAMIKPTALIALPVVLVYVLFAECKPIKEDILKYVGIVSAAVAGLLLPILAALIYLLSNNALNPFVDIAANYWPLFRDFSGFHQEFSGFQELKYLLLNLRTFGGFEVWTVVALINAFCAIALFKAEAQRKKIITLLIALAVTFYLYPALSGQFYGYHWLPFLYFIVLLSSLAFVKPPKELHISLKFLPVIVLVLACIISFKLPGGAFRNIYGDYDVVAPDGGVPDEIAEYLNAHLEPGDKVQPLDWAWGGIHGVLLARGELATSFIYDFHFYHHVNDEYIEGLRRRFVTELEENRPRFIVEIPYEAHPRNNSLGHEREFPELRDFIEDNYIIVDSKEGDGYIIYERVGE
ncbi:MAG: hypothetical protein GY771_13545 [bacterium]|nr:hypothetical protein [bacterium]